MASIADQLRAAAAPIPLPASPAAAPQPATASLDTNQTPQAPAQPCSCGFRTFWLDSYGNWSCSSCKPPKFAFMARRTITIAADGSTEEISADDESRYEKFIEITGADRRVHLVHCDCLNPRSDRFDIQITKKISMGVEAADNENLLVHRFLSSVLQGHGSIDPLPGPWPQQEINFSALPDENANLPKNKKTRKPRGGRRK